MEFSGNLLLLLCLDLLYLGLHHRDLLPQLVHQLVLVPVGLLTWWLGVQLSLQLSYHLLVFSSSGISFLRLLNGKLCLFLSLIVFIGSFLKLLLESIACHYYLLIQIFSTLRRYG